MTRIVEVGARERVRIEALTRGVRLTYEVRHPWFPSLWDATTEPVLLTSVRAVQEHVPQRGALRLAVLAAWTESVAERARRERQAKGVEA